MSQKSIRPRFDMRISVVVADDIEVWQKLNVATFVVSGIAATVDQILGEPYEDGSGNLYLPMFREPVMVHGASRANLGAIHNRATHRGVPLAIFTEDLFTTYSDVDAHAAVRAIPADALELVGLAFRTNRKNADKILAGISLHR